MKLLSVTSKTATFELDNDKPYFHSSCEIYLNDEFIKSSDKNVFTLFDLKPDFTYIVRVNEETLSFTTKHESVCLNVKRFGAKGDGSSDDTAFIQAAILSTPKDGTCYLPEGIYKVKPLFLKSDMMLYLAKGAVLLAKTQRKEYPILPKCEEVTLGVWEGNQDDEFASVLNCINVENVTITGEGCINGDAKNGDWYIHHRKKNIAWRGHLIFTNQAKNILIEGLDFQDSMSWTIHPFLSEDIRIFNIRIQNNPQMPTTDGIDIDISENISIIGTAISVGDDCIAIKSGSYELAKKYQKPSSNIVIRNNYMRKGHGGVVIGSESSGGVSVLSVSDCLFENTDRGLRIKTRRGRGCIHPIDQIKFNHIQMEKVKTPFVINMYYNMGNAGGHEEYVWTTKKLPKDEYTPVIGNFEFTNIICNEVGYAAGVFLGLPESNIGNLTLKNVVFHYNKSVEEGNPVMIEHNFKLKNAGLVCFNTKNIILDNVTFDGIEGEEIIRKENL